MRIYISGPMTGIGEFIYRTKFYIAQEALEAVGNEVVNPVVVGDRLRGKLTQRGVWEGLTESEQYEKYMEADLAEIPRCGGIYMLAGWESSSGARRELAEAIRLEKLIILQEIAL